MLCLDFERVRHFLDDRTDFTLPLDTRAADRLTREIASDSGTLLDDGQRVCNRFGSGVGRTRLADPAKEHGERIGDIMEDACKIVGLAL